MNIFVISSILAFVVCTSLAAYVYVKSKIYTNRLFALQAMMIGVWSLFPTVLMLEETKALLLVRIIYIGAIFTPPVFTSFCFRLLNLDKNKSEKLILKFLYIVSIFLLFILFNQNFISGIIKLERHNTIIPGKLFIIFPIVFISACSYDFLRLIICYLNASGLKRNQYKYFIVSFLFAFFAALLHFYPIFLKKSELFPHDILLASFAFITAYAIIRHRLMDMNIAFTRAGIFIAIYSLVLGIPFALAFGYQARLIGLLGHNWWIVPLASSTLLATIGPFIYLYINRRAEEKLLKEQRSYQNILRNASSGMIRIKNLKQLLNVVVHVITKTVKLKSAAIYLFDKETNNFVIQAKRGAQGFGNFEHSIDSGSPLVYELSSTKKPIVTEEAVMRLRDEAQNQSMLKFVEQLLKFKASLVVPSFVEDRLIAILILGEKKSRKLYSQDDIVIFSVLANQAALAIENAQFYDEVKRTHEQLFQAEKLATIGTMADGLSHQINNRFHALSLISGDALDILKTYDASACNEEAKQVFSDLKSALERIEANVLQGGEVVKGLLKYSRPGEGGFELVKLHDILAGAIDMVQYKIKLKEIDLIQDIPFDLPKFHGNMTQLQEVFFNLIDNAYDATQERRVILKEEGFKGRIEIIARTVNGSVEISIKDNGMGIKDLDKKKLFTPFFTTKATAKKGTGLGLYVIDKIVGAHNGKISIDSVHKSGTCFTITLPISARP